MTESEADWKANVIANLREARKKNGRLGSKKSRRGCATCKARRIKCDETKPECDRCLSTGRKCSGYGTDYGSSPSSTSSISSASFSSTSISSAANSPIRNELSPKTALRDADRRVFDYFLSYAAPRLAGALDQDLWCGHVLQIAHTEPLIMDSLLAISALYEHPQYASTFRDSPFRLGDGPGAKGSSERQIYRIGPDRHHVYALTQYNKAIQAFKARIEDGTATPVHALLSCLLFTCIEVIRDNIFAAMNLFARGSALLSQFEDAITAERGQGPLTMIKYKSSRLWVLAAAFGHGEQVQRSLDRKFTDERTVFGNLTDARTFLFDLMSESQPYTRKTGEWKEYVIMDKASDVTSADLYAGGWIMMDKFDTVSNIRFGGGGLPWSDGYVPSEIGRTVATTDHLIDDDQFPGMKNHSMPDDLTAALERTHFHLQGMMPLPESDPHYRFNDLCIRRDYLLQRLDKWYNAFQNIDHPEKEADLGTQSHLLMYYHLTLIWLSSRLSPSERVFDKYTYHFRELVRHAEIYIKSQTAQNPAFVFEVGVIPPIYFTAIKCRVPSIRRQALRLFQYAPGKECTWGNTNTAELAYRLISIEESGLGLPDCGELDTIDSVDDTVMPKEGNRIHRIEIQRNRTTLTHDIKVTRYSIVQGHFQRSFEIVPI